MLLVRNNTFCFSGFLARTGFVTCAPFPSPGINIRESMLAKMREYLIVPSNTIGLSELAQLGYYGKNQSLLKVALLPKNKPVHLGFS